MRIKLLGARIHVAPLPQATKSPGGIDYCQSYRDDERLWYVLAVGPGYLTKKGERVALEITPGDKVLTVGVPQNEYVLEDGSMIMFARQAIMAWR